MEVIGFPVGSLMNECRGSKKDVYWSYNPGNPYSIWIVFTLPIVRTLDYGLDHNHRKCTYLRTR